jgi:septal ring-binding cell division protein DamX
VTTSQDDGFREIQLSGKQLVFLFMAVTVVLVVTFLTGVLVGRGVRVERSESAQADALTESPVAPPHTAVATPADADPTKAAPPAPAENGAETDAKPAAVPEPAEEPPVAVKRTPPPSAPPAVQPAAAAKITAPAAKPPAVASASAKPAADPATPAASGTPDATDTQRSGYAVQVAAVNARGEADAIVKRLSGKGYAAYVEMPKGNASMFRVRVGTFKTRREAQTIADKLKKEEKFKPWVTR